MNITDIVIALHNDKAENYKTAKSDKIKLVCQECGKSKRVSPNAIDPQCSCGSVDLEVA